MSKNWEDFLEQIADEHYLDQEKRDTFLSMFAEKGKIKSVIELSVALNLGEPAVKTRMGKVYDKFPKICPRVNGKRSKGQASTLQVWLIQQYSAQSKPKSLEATFSNTIDSPDWKTICSQRLNSQKQQQHLRQQVTQIGCEIDVYVPLGLVERKHQSRRRDNYSLPPEQGSGFFQPTEEEIIHTYEHNEFLEEVIQQGKSKKSKGKRIAIIGEPGAGKTTTLAQIAFSTETPGFPIWISLKSLGEKSLEQYLRENWLKDALKTSDFTQQQKDLEELFKTGKVLLLLDGVDEMPASSPVNALGKIREELTSWVADARVVLTCRLNVWEASVNSLQGFDIYRTLDFSYGDGDKPDQVKQFICDWFIKAEKPELGEPLREKLEEDRDQRIRDLVKNPLRLSLLCQSWYFKQGALPKTKAMLYEQFTRAFYEWKNEPFHTSVTERKKLNTALGLLAREAIDQEKSRFAIRESFAVDVMGEDLFNLACRLHWLNFVYKDADTDEKVFAFFHPTFQEYFAACAIDDWDYFLKHAPYNPTQGTYRIFERQWKEVILLWLGQEEVAKDKKEEFIQALTNFNDGCEDFYLENGDKGFYKLRGYFLAASGIGEFQKSIHGERVLSKLVKLSEGDFDIEKQQLITSMEPIAKEAKVVLQAIDRRLSISYLINLLTSLCEYGDYRNDYLIITICTICELVLERDSKNMEVIVTLKQLFNGTDFSRRSLARVLIENGVDDLEAREIDDKTKQVINHAIQDYTKKNQINFVDLVIQGGRNLVSTMEIYVDGKDINNLIKQLMNSEGLMLIATIGKLGSVSYGNIEVILAMIKLLITSENNSDYEFIGEMIIGNLSRIITHEVLPPIIYFFRKYLTDEVCKKDYVLYKLCYKFLWQCAQNMSYPDFYYAWRGQLPPIQALENQLIDIPSQLQPTEKTYPIAIDTQSLKLETNTNAIAQKLCTKIYRKAGYFEIPTTSDAAQLQQYIPRIQEKLQKPNLALILYNCEPKEQLIDLCYNLADSELGIYICLITKQPLEQPLKGFLPEQPNLISAIQSWINEIG